VAGAAAAAAARRRTATPYSLPTERIYNIYATGYSTHPRAVRRVLGWAGLGWLLSGCRGLLTEQPARGAPSLSLACAANCACAPCACPLCLCLGRATPSAELRGDAAMLVRLLCGQALCECHLGAHYEAAGALEMAERFMAEWVSAPEEEADRCGLSVLLGATRCLNALWWQQGQELGGQPVSPRSGAATTMTQLTKDTAAVARELLSMQREHPTPTRLECAIELPGATLPSAN
jgi:hypothetical protein